ncbi:hypothetical protein SAM23877_2319 [Streptomyces ambofaciens ATCC 23877]|uniref:Uncharacterized protein n=1 Tax=Streptomyces ambofaciens (strain ATCC 23877 / 3486 / DSM 40053 / JCM 4204 / NBRC 12836 / NRRL B-2516) TaxID=278992 RepID=A0A0K2AQU2_STRA7|nr:hypothetical protein SAM23877_2319 [Streptomyces ambofaciens ATCC 23877]
MSASRVVTGVDCTCRPPPCTPIGRRGRPVGRPGAGCCVIALPRESGGKSLQSLAQPARYRSAPVNKRLTTVANRSRTDNFGDLLHFFAARPFAVLTTLLRSRRPTAAVTRSVSAGAADGPAPCTTRAFTLKENSCGVA